MNKYNKLHFKKVAHFINKLLTLEEQMKSILLIIGIVFLLLGIVALVATGFLGFVFYVPLFIIGALCLLFYNTQSKK